MRTAIAGLVIGGVLTGCAAPERPPTSTRTFAGASVLEPWTQALRGSGREAATVVVLGDSVSEGYGIERHLERRWVDRLQRSLRRRAGVPGCPTTPGGFHGTTSLVPADYRAPSLPDPATSGEVTPLTDVGPGGRAVQLGADGVISWRVDARSVDIGYRTRRDGGLMRVEIDGRTAIHGLAVPTGADDEGERQVWSSGELGPGTHTVTVRNASEAGAGTPVTVTDLLPHRGDRGRCVHVLDASRSAVLARSITETPGYLADSLDLDPDLLLVALGFNDARAGAGPADFGRVLDRLIEQVRALGYDGPVLLVGWFTPDLGDELPAWSDYLDEMAERTEHEGVSFLDLSAVLPPVGWAPDGVYRDDLHPGPRGQVLIARSLAEVLGPRADLDATPADD